jgi:hypothetical protein
MPSESEFLGTPSLKWLDTPPADLSNSVDLFYSSLGKAQAAACPDTLLRSIQHVCSMLAQPRLGCSGSAAACIAIAALAQHAAKGPLNVYSSMCAAVSTVMNSLLARQGLHATAMLLVLIGGLRRASWGLPAHDQVPALYAVTTGVPAESLMPGGTMRDAMVAWVHGTNGLWDALVQGGVLHN